MSVGPVSSSRPDSSLCATIAVFGCSGLLAKECVYQALKDGNTVVGLTRNPSNVDIPQGSGGADAGKPLTGPKLTVIAGDVTKQVDVDKVFATGKIDGVVVALGGKTKDVGETMLRDGTSNVIKAMKDNGVKRLSVVTSIGAGDSEDQVSVLELTLVISHRRLLNSSHTFIGAFLFQSPDVYCYEENLCRSVQVWMSNILNP